MGKDDGKGKLGDYKYDLLPANKRVTIVLADCDPHQDELERISGLSEPQAFISHRTLEEERTDAPVAVRVFGESRMSSIVGFVPRGLEAPVFEALARLERDGQTRIPARIERTRAGLRLVLLMGLTR